MKKVAQMDKTILHKNLMSTIDEIVSNIEVHNRCYKFIIVPVYEKNKPLNALDDLMRLVFLSEKNIGNRLLSIEQTINLIGCHSPLVPIWINVSLSEINDTDIIFRLETSLRCRKPSLLRNAETGHPPFKAIV